MNTINLLSLQQHMIQSVGLAIHNPIIDGQWHSGSRSDGKGADKISYVTAQTEKGLLVRYRDHRNPEVFHVWKEWTGQPENNSRRISSPMGRRSPTDQGAQADKQRIARLLQAVWQEGQKPDLQHPYIERKRIIPMGIKQAAKRYTVRPAINGRHEQYIAPGTLLVPLYSTSTGGLIGIEAITPHGQKIAHGKRSGGCLWLGGALSTGENKGRIYIAEGYATAISVHMRTRNPVIVAFSTGNLLPVASWVREQHPESEIVVASDHDKGSFITVDGEEVENPGLVMATKAAEAVEGFIAHPPLQEKGDWNDWHIQQIQQAQKNPQSWH